MLAGASSLLVLGTIKFLSNKHLNQHFIISGIGDLKFLSKRPVKTIHKMREFYQSSFVLETKRFKKQKKFAQRGKFSYQMIIDLGVY